MTRDEILSMPAGREMDVLIAEKVMGWKTGERGVNAGYWVNDKGKEVHFKDTWYPSADVTVAWEVVEKFKGISLRCHGKFWFCDFDVEGKDYEYSQSLTAPLAICRAALLAVME